MRLRGGALLLLLLAPLASSASEVGGDVRASIGLAPEVADPSLPFTFLLRVEGPPGTRVEVRAWVGGPASVSSELEADERWVRGTRYGLEWTLDDRGGATRAVTLRALDGVEAGATMLRVKVRSGSAVAGDEEPLLWRKGAGAPVQPPQAPGAALTAIVAGERILATAPPGGLLPRWGDASGVQLHDGDGRVLSRHAVPPPPQLLLSALFPRPHARAAAEAATLRNEGAQPVSLAGVCIVSACLAGGALAPGVERTFARSPAAHASEGGGASHALEGLFLPDETGCVRLRLGSHSLDAICYGEGAEGEGWAGPPRVAPRAGELLVRKGAVDTDAAEDWPSLLRRRLGQSSFPPMKFEIDGPLSPYVTPDAGVQPLLALFQQASSTLDAEVYTLTSGEVARGLADAAARGVRVRLLVDGSPVGGLPEREGPLLAALLARGVEVRWMRALDEVPPRYSTLHAKFVVADGRVSHVASENWNPHAYPSEPASSGGSRGWGLVVEDRALAAALVAVFSADWNAFDAQVPDARLLPPPAVLPPVVPPAAWGGPDFRGANATLVLAPDSALAEGGLPRLLADAARSIDLHQLRVEARWGSGPNPLLEETLSAARRGARVRALLDGTFEREEALAVADRFAAAGAQAIVAPPTRVHHNKGLLVDGQLVVVGSLNWGLASATRNREVALVIESGDVAAFFARAFDADWASPGGPVPREAPAGTALLALLLALAFTLRPRGGTRRRSPPS